VKSQKVKAGGQKVEQGSSKNWKPGIVIPQKWNTGQKLEVWNNGRSKSGNRGVKKWKQPIQAKNWKSATTVDQKVELGGQKVEATRRSQVLYRLSFPHKGHSQPKKDGNVRLYCQCIQVGVAALTIQQFFEIILSLYCYYNHVDVATFKIRQFLRLRVSIVITHMPELLKWRKFH
jgi:hypothetical protein